jgi:hypothetical protein
MPRSTKAETEQRIEQVYKLLLGGAAFPDIREFACASEQNWAVTDTQVRRYMTEAHRRIKERYEARADYSFSKHMLRREQLYAHAVGAGDFGTALRILDSEAKLEGLFPPTKVAPTNPEGTDAYDAGGFTPAEVTAILGDLAARLVPETAPEDGQG